MISIKVITSNTRGFLRNLFEASSEKLEFHYEKKYIYEIVGFKRKILANMIKWPIFDVLGIFQIVKADNVTEDACFSYNRFLSGNRPYLIFLENPSALVNYCWERPKHYIAKKRLEKCFNNPNLKGIVCMSKACYEKIENLYIIPSQVKLYQVYPFVADDLSYSIENAVNCAKNNRIIECLFISSDFELKGGRDILELFEKIEKEDMPIHVSIITRKNSVNEGDIKRINALKSISLVEFNLTKEQLDEYYKNASILLNPTRGDSFSLVTLEAIKYGCAILATDIYAIKEMDIDGYNGFISKSMFKVWDEDGTMNKYYRTHQKEILYSGKIDDALVRWMYDKLKDFINDRELLGKMCANSLKLARGTGFSANDILNSWESIYEQAVSDRRKAI